MKGHIWIIYYLKLSFCFKQLLSLRAHEFYVPFFPNNRSYDNNS